MIRTLKCKAPLDTCPIPARRNRHLTVSDLPTQTKKEASNNQVPSSCGALPTDGPTESTPYYIESPHSDPKIYLVLIIFEIYIIM